MDHATYAVVLFEEDQTCSEVPTSWISPSKTSCWWPNTKNVSSLISKGVTPDKNNPITWKLFRVQVQGYYDTLDAARKRATDADYTSAEDEKGRGLRRKKKALRVISDSEDSYSGKENSPPPSLMVDHSEITAIANSDCRNSESVSYCNRTLLENVEENVQDSDTNFLDNQQSTPDRTEDRTLTSYDMGRDIKDLTDKVDYLIKINKKIFMYVKEIEGKMEKSNVVEKHLSASLKDIQEKFPMQTTDELVELDDILKKDDDLKKCFVSYVKSIGGRGFKEMVSRIMGKLITNSLGISCSLLGKRNHFPFKHLELMNNILNAVRQTFPDTSESAIELAVGEWLRLSKLRQSREKPLQNQ
ncbi:uncharacterized protein LOC116176113 [Photinus pyralis]|nr:uncharacterized protein LOC116176113 [Photinus pyralis]